MEPLPPPGPSSSPLPGPPVAPRPEPPRDVASPPPPLESPGSRSATPVIVTIAVLGLVGALVVAGVLAYVVLRDRSSSSAARKPTAEAQQLLDRVRTYARARQTVQWDFNESIAADGSGAARAFTATGSFESVLAQSSRVVTTAGGYTSEVLEVRTDQWIRVGPEGQIDRVKWRPLDVPVRFSTAALAAALFENTSSPVLESKTAESFVLRVQSGPEQLFFLDAGAAFTTRTMRITAKTSGEVTTFSAEGRGTRTRLTYDARNVRWDQTVELQAPTGDQLDATPNIDEEAIAAFKEATALAPAQVYRGFELQQATVLAPEETEEKCAQARVSWANPANGAIIDTFSLPVACASERSSDAEDITVNGNSGWVGTKAGDTFAEIVVGNTRYQIRTSLPREQLLPLLENLVPFDPANPPPATKIPGKPS